MLAGAYCISCLGPQRYGAQVVDQECCILLDRHCAVTHCYLNAEKRSAWIKRSGRAFLSKKHENEDRDCTESSWITTDIFSGLAKACQVSLLFQPCRESEKLSHVIYWRHSAIPNRLWRNNQIGAGQTPDSWALKHGPMSSTWCVLCHLEDHNGKLQQNRTCSSAALLMCKSWIASYWQSKRPLSIEFLTWWIQEASICVF